MLADIWCQVLGIERIGLDDDFFALGGTSLQAVEAFSEIESRLGRILPLSVLFKAGSIRELLVELDSPQPPAQALIEIQPHGARPALFVIPGIGGDTVALAGLARILGPAQPFYGFQSLGLDGQRRPLTRIDQIAAANIAEMDAIAGEPFVLCGVCWGALIALEMARQLRDAGRTPDLLVVVDPAYHPSDPVASAASDPRLATVRFISGRLKLYWSEFRAADGVARWRLLAQKGSLIFARLARRDLFGGSRSEMIRESVQSANMQAQLNYTPSRYNGVITAVLTSDRAIGSSDPRLSWLERVAPDAPRSFVPGTVTGDLMSGANVRVLADKLHALIDVLVAD